MDGETLQDKPVSPCSTCHQEVEADDAALLCEVCEQWEHIECIRVCDRPSLELYTILSVSSSKALVFTCTACRRKGTLARQLAEAHITLSSMHTQLGIYERLLKERQRLVENLATEKDALQLENLSLHEQVEEARRASDKLVHKAVGSSGHATKPLSVSAPEFVSTSLQLGHVTQAAGSSVGKRKLPSLPTTTPTMITSVMPTNPIITPARINSTVLLANPVVTPAVISSFSNPVVTTTRISSSVLPPRIERLNLDAASPQVQPSGGFKHPPGFKKLRERE